MPKQPTRRRRTINKKAFLRPERWEKCSREANASTTAHNQLSNNGNFRQFISLSRCAEWTRVELFTFPRLQFSRGLFALTECHLPLASRRPEKKIFHFMVRFNFFIFTASSVRQRVFCSPSGGTSERVQNALVAIFSASSAARRMMACRT
jgi:hypothetical protein